MDYVYFEELHTVPDFRETYDIAASMAVNPRRVLDMAGGVGIIGKIFEKRRCQYTNVDASGLIGEFVEPLRPVTKGDILRLDELIDGKFDTIFLLNFYSGGRIPKADDFLDFDRMALIQAAESLKAQKYRLTYTQAANAIEEGGKFIISGFYDKESLEGAIRYLAGMGFENADGKHIVLSDEAGKRFVQHDLDKRFTENGEYHKLIDFYMNNYHIRSFDMKGPTDAAKRLPEMKEEYFQAEDDYMAAEMFFD